MTETPIERAGRLAAALRQPGALMEPALGQAGGFVDQRMLMQAGVGMIYGLVGVPFWPAAGLAVGLEAGRRLFASGPKESAGSAAVDVAAALAGWWFTSKYGRRRKKR